MAQTPHAAGRIDPEVVEAARVAARLPESVTTAYVVRYAIAVLAGVPEPARVAQGRRVGRPRRAVEA